MDLGRRLLGRRRRARRRGRDDRRGAGRRHVSRRHEARDRAPSDRRRARAIVALALYGSFLPRAAGGRRRGRPAAVPRDGAPGDVARRATARSSSTKAARPSSCRSPTAATGPIQVGSHYHFIETNRALAFDRRAAYGMRLDIPAGTAVRFEPGETKTVTLVAIAGRARDPRRQRAGRAGPVDRAGQRPRGSVVRTDEPSHQTGSHYADIYGPTTGDRVRLGDTQLVAEVESGRHRLRRRVQVRRRQGAARRHGPGGRRLRRRRARLRDHQRAHRRLDRHPQGRRRHQGRPHRRHRQGGQPRRDGRRHARAWSSASRPRRSRAKG